MPFVTVPLKFALGTNRTRVFAFDVRSRADAAVGEPSALQLDPPFVEYSHEPLVLTTPVMAIPDDAPLSASVICPLISADTSVPALLESSSLIPVRLFAPDNTGASFTELTV